MTLLLPAPPAFGYFVTNEDSPASASAYGTTLTGGAADTKGSWSSILSTISYDLYRLDITVTDSGTGNSSVTHLFDLGIGPDASNVTVVAENLIGCNVSGLGSGGRQYRGIPLYIPAGTQLWGRNQSSTASKTMDVAVSAWGAPDHPESVPKISFIEALGESTGSTTGTAITPGASGTLGTATSMGSFSNDVCAVFMGMSSDDSTLSAVGYVGALTTDATATVQELGIGGLMNGNTSEDVRATSWPLWCDIPAGQTVGLRMSCTGTADSTMWAIAYGCVRG